MAVTVYLSCLRRLKSRDLSLYLLSFYPFFEYEGVQDLTLTTRGDTKQWNRTPDLNLPFQLLQIGLRQLASVVPTYVVPRTSDQVVIVYHRRSKPDFLVIQEYKVTSPKAYRALAKFKSTNLTPKDIVTLVQYSIRSKNQNLLREVVKSGVVSITIECLDPLFDYDLHSGPDTPPFKLIEDLIMLLLPYLELNPEQEEAAEWFHHACRYGYGRVVQHLVDVVGVSIERLN